MAIDGRPMTETVAGTPSLPDVKSEDVVTYRSVSFWAIAAGALGPLSAVALIHPIWWWVPVLAVIVAVVALRAVAARSAELIGRGGALFGLVLAIVIGASAPVRLFSRGDRLDAEARKHADEWFRLVKDGRYYEVYELSLPAAKRQTADASLETIYGTDFLQPADRPNLQGPMGFQMNDPRSAIREYFELPTLRKLLAVGNRGEYIYQGCDSQINKAEFSSDDVSLRYLLRYQEEGQPRELQVYITLVRNFRQQERKASWHVQVVSDSPGPPS
jgi:hypothetical protein